MRYRDPDEWPPEHYEPRYRVRTDRVRCCDCDGSGWWQYDDEWLSRQKCATCGGTGEVAAEGEDDEA